mgnify:CR=1 FL=1
MGEMMWAVVVEDDAPLKLAQVEKPSCGPSDVIVKVMTAGLNRADLVQRMGLYPPPPGASEIMGLECSGEIVEVGSDVSGWAVGDRVCGLMAGGGYAEFAAVDQGSLFKTPDGMSYEEAGALPEVMMTVWANILIAANLKPGKACSFMAEPAGLAQWPSKWPKWLALQRS